MSTLNFIPPTPAAAECGVRSAECGVFAEPARLEDIPHSAFRIPQFELVMEGLPGFFPGALPPARAKSSQAASTEAPPRKKEADNKNAGAANDQPPNLQTKSDLPPAGVAPPVAELAVATAPVVSAGKTVADPAKSPANSETETSGVATVGFERGKSTGADSGILSETEGGAANSSMPAQKSMPAKDQDHMDLPATSSPVTSGAPVSDPARLENQPLRAGSETGAPVSQGSPVAKMADGIAEIQQQPAIIADDLRFTNDDLRVVNPSASQSQIVNADGTAVAKQDVTMKTTAKETNCSGVKQKLPGAAAVASGEILPTRSEREVVPATITIRVDPATPTGAGISANDSTARAVSPEILDLPRIAPSVVPHVQRTRELVSLQVMRLHESGADEMRMVIKPDRGLQLSLHLLQRGDEVEVQAVLDRGNFGLLNRHWPELQQQLELRGVRVAPLVNAEQSFGGGSEGFRQPTTSHGQQAGDDADTAEMPPVLLPGLPTATATASASTISSRHLETWA
jgi:hypothetical protein